MRRSSLSSRRYARDGLDVARLGDTLAGSTRTARDAHETDPRGARHGIEIAAVDRSRLKIGDDHQLGASALAREPAAAPASARRGVARLDDETRLRVASQSLRLGSRGVHRAGSVGTGALHALARVNDDRATRSLATIRCVACA